jgi:hypothetical protein
MQNRLLTCATYLQEVQEKLSALRDVFECDSSERLKVTEAMLFVDQARRAISETQTRVDSLRSLDTEQSAGFEIS